jgi:hypothetical protein
MGNVVEISLFLQSDNEEIVDPKVVSVFKQFGFENPNSERSEQNDFERSPVCSFLEKVQAIFIDEISGAPFTESSNGEFKQISSLIALLVNNDYFEHWPI